jgi:HAD superfamily hydrolase (TIGR01509 family)
VRHFKVMPPLRAILFDFNGVIADDELAHFIAFQQALGENELSITKEQYYGAYLGMDERNCLRMLLEKDATSLERRILERKADLFERYSRCCKPPLFPGVIEFVKEAGRCYRLAIATGGQRRQVLFALKDTPIERDFAVMVSAEDTTVGKPDPQIYRLTLERLNLTSADNHLIKPDECLVIEDSLAGIQAGLAAGMKVGAVATTYPAERLAGAHLTVPCLTRAALGKLEKLFQ